MAAASDDITSQLAQLQTASARLAEVQQKANSFVETQQLEVSGLICDLEDFTQLQGNSPSGPLRDRAKKLTSGLNHLADHFNRMIESYDKQYPSGDRPGPSDSHNNNNNNNNVPTTTVMYMRPVALVNTDHLDHLVDDYSRPHTFTPPEPTVPTEIKQPKLDPTTQLDVILSWLESPSLFWVQLETEIANSTLAEGLKNAINWPAVADITIGQYVAAPQAELFYRAQVVDLAPNSSGVQFAKVLYIDYGNTGWVGTSVVKQLSDDLFYYDWQAVRCRLAKLIPANRVSWSDSEIQRFSDLLKEESPEGDEISRGLVMEVAEVVEEETTGLITTVVFLSGEGSEDVGDQMVDGGSRSSPEGRHFPNESQDICGPPECPEPWQIVVEVAAGGESSSASFLQIPPAVIPPKAQFQAQLTAFHYPEYFYVTPTSNMEDLRCFQGQVDSFCGLNLDSIEKLWTEGEGNPQLLVGSPCIVSTGAESDGPDRHFYRCEVLRYENRSEGDFFGILFVDSGYEDWRRADEIFKMDSFLAATPRYAISCRLAQVKPIGVEWPEAVEAKFHSLVGRTDLVVEKLGFNGDSLSVSLLVPSGGRTSRPTSLAEDLIRNDLGTRCF